MTYQPQRGDSVEAWLKARRDFYNDDSKNSLDAEYWAVDRILDDYRAHADFGVPLGQELPEEAFR